MVERWMPMLFANCAGFVPKRSIKCCKRVFIVVTIDVTKVIINLFTKIKIIKLSFVNKSERVGGLSTVGQIDIIVALLSTLNV